MQQRETAMIWLELVLVSANLISATMIVRGFLLKRVLVQSWLPPELERSFADEPSTWRPDRLLRS